MEDVLTEIPPPSRFSEEDLNNFSPPSRPLPSPFLAFPSPKPNEPLRPSLLIVAVSSSSLYLFHQLPSKTLLGSLILPEIPCSGNSIKPSLRDKSCNVYALGGLESSILLVSVQCPVAPERCHVVARTLIGGEIVPERVLVLDSVQRQNFRGSLSSDDTLAFRVETSAERKRVDDGSVLKRLCYFPSGSMLEGLGAALLSRCEVTKIKGTLCATWPEAGGAAVSVTKSLLKSIFPGVDFGACVDAEEEYSGPRQDKNHLLDSQLYT